MTVGKGRRNAGELAAERGWKAGDAITSSQWAHPGRIHRVHPNGLDLYYGKPARVQFVRTLPTDVEAVSEAVTVRP